MEYLSVLKTVVFGVLGGLSLVIALAGGFGLAIFLLDPTSYRSTANIIWAVVALLAGSFLFLFLGRKLYQPFYLLVPISFIIAFGLGNLIGLYGKDWKSIFILCLFPIITFKLIEKYYAKKSK